MDFIEGTKFVIVFISIYYLFKVSKDGITYKLIANLILLINFIGNIFLEDAILTTTNINFFIFIILHNISYDIFSKYKVSVINYNRNTVFRNSFGLNNIFLFCLLLSIWFFFKVGLLVFQDDPLEAREMLGYGSGIFSRIILYSIPILSGIYVAMFNRHKKYKYMIYPITAILLIFLTGYRGYMAWTVIYFFMVSNYFRKIKPYSIKIIIGLAVFLLIATFITQKYYMNLSWDGALDLFVKRIFEDNVYGYNILINEYIKSHDVTIWNMNDLPQNLFAWNFGEGRLVDLSSQLTVTLPGMTFALGGYTMTILFGLLIGSIAGIVNKLNQYSKDFTLLAFRTFILFSIITLLNRGFITTFLTIPILSMTFMYLSILLVSKSYRSRVRLH